MQWISVKDGLPSEGELLALYSPACEEYKGSEQTHIGVGVYEDSKFYYDVGQTGECGEPCCFNEPTHWMLLPLPPKE